MRLLLTRPLADSRPLAARLEAAGHHCLLAPLLDLRIDTEAPLPLAGMQALLLTSANGARALAARSVPRTLPVFAVGDATARAAAGAGFRDVRSADGTVGDLAALVARDCRAGNGGLLHIAGSAVAGDLAGDLGARGFALARAVLYEATPAAALPDETAQALASRQIDGGLFFSPRTMRTFASLLARAGLSETSAALVQFALSPAVAEAGEALVWRQVRVARRPTQDDLLAAVEEYRDGDERS